VTSTSDYVQATRAYPLWTKKGNIAWLKSRGVNIDSKTAVDTIKPIVWGMVDSGPPPVMPPEGGVEDVTRYIYYISCIVAHVIQTIYTEDHILEMERHIKLFLAVFENMNKLLRDTNMLPKWIAACRSRFHNRAPHSGVIPTPVLNRK
jgi:hypothetical protein